MPGSDIGNLDALLWPREQQDNYLIWRRSGEQGDQWMKASVDVGYTGESQVGRELLMPASNLRNFVYCLFVVSFIEFQYDQSINIIIKTDS